MVEHQLRGRGIRDPRVLGAFLSTPRHRFVKPTHTDQAYEDHPLDIGYGQTISQPYMVALMTEALGLIGAERVLEIGTGSGYQTAILAELSLEVLTVERIPELAAEAQRVLGELGFGNIRFRVGDGTLGWPEEAPFDRILVAAAAPAIPKPLTDQLAEGGRLVVPVGSRGSQDLTLIQRRAGELHQQSLGGCVFVPLIGQEGWLS
jgi:protein-L-isoaspartate(D-aspartate) O-methyltransferase